MLFSTYVIKGIQDLYPMNHLLSEALFTANRKILSSPSPKSGPLRPKPKAVLNPNPSPIGTGHNYARVGSHMK